MEKLVLTKEAMTTCVLGMHGEVASSVRQSDSEAFRAQLTCRDTGAREPKIFLPLSGTWKAGVWSWLRRSLYGTASVKSLEI